MGCDSPIQAFRAGTINPATGKRPLQFTRQGSFSGVRMGIPCGKCTGCRLEHSRRWAVRLMHENKMHKFSEFITLTYRNEDLPEVGTLVPSHLQAFHKRLHNRLLYERGYGIRYYACGEYGDENKRPHYHSILFSAWFADRKLYGYSNGNPIYTSELLDEIWGLGSCKIAAVTFETCAYVARYVTKKVDGKQREAGHYQVYDYDGVVHERVPEFSVMSRRPGIGAPYLAKYGKEIMTHDSVIVNGREVPSVRYYDLWIEKNFPGKIELIKKRRHRKMMLAPWLERVSPDRRRVKEILRIKALKEKVRRL